VLWDIDGTLISAGPTTWAIYPQTFQVLTGRAARHTVDIHGRTELDIMSELFARHGLPEPPEEVICEALTAALRSQRAKLRAGGRVLAGAVETLTWFARTPEILQTVLTGNLRVNAELKLGTFGLARFVDFDVGGYGCDHRIRSRLVGVARTRAAARGFSVRDTVLIGDTARDVQAARDNGLRVVAVATGSTGAAELRLAGANIVLSDLMDPAAVLAAVRGDDRGPPR
jgi:phosphoglycolate phosphatase-like HAD superfamily hydrolase